MIIFVKALITMSFTGLFMLTPTVVVAYHGQEISISLDHAEFIPLGEEGNQVNVFSNYTVNDPSLLNQEINSVMKSILNKWNINQNIFLCRRIYSESNWFSASCNYDN
jgi:hypothetical protein